METKLSNEARAIYKFIFSVLGNTSTATQDYIIDEAFRKTPERIPALKQKLHNDCENDFIWLIAESDLSVLQTLTDYVLKY